MPPRPQVQHQKHPFKHSGGHVFVGAGVSARGQSHWTTGKYWWGVVGLCFFSPVHSVMSLASLPFLQFPTCSFVNEQTFALLHNCLIFSHVLQIWRCTHLQIVASNWKLPMSSFTGAALMNISKHLSFYLTFTIYPLYHSVLLTLCPCTSRVFLLLFFSVIPLPIMLNTFYIFPPPLPLCSYVSFLSPDNFLFFFCYITNVYVCV